MTGSSPGKFVVPVKGDEAFSLVTINILPSPEVAILEGMMSLAEYPHGCMEQTCSSTLPNVIVLEYLEATRKLTDEFEEKLLNNMIAGYHRMMTYRNKDGGFSYWGGESSVFFTALGISVISRMKKYIEKSVKGLDDVLSSARSYLFGK